MEKKIKVLYVGDAAGVIPVIAQSPYIFETKGLVLEASCQLLLDILNSQPEIEVTYLPNWEVQEKFPEKPEDLAKYGLVVISDIESEIILLYPIYPSGRFLQAPMGPNRLKLVRDYVKNGGSLLMIGGWYSFTGKRALANYHNTPVEEALPVNCLEVNDDRVEEPEGVRVVPLVRKHPVMEGIPWETCPVFTGYNKLELKKGATLLAKVKETGDPFIAVWEYGKGKAMAFASDVAPHWGAGFVGWEHYGKFWLQTVRWLGSR